MGDKQPPGNLCLPLEILPATGLFASVPQSFDLGAENRRLLHDGPLTWRIQHRKVVGECMAMAGSP